MPYIVTTRQPAEPPNAQQGVRAKPLSRVAVGTLMAAHNAVYWTARERRKPVDPYPTDAEIQEAIAHGVGCVTLPDGAVVEVEPIGWAYLARIASPAEARDVEGAWPADYLRMHRRNVLAEYNEEHGSEGAA